MCLTVSQRPFSKSNKTPGKFIVEEEQTAIAFDGVSPLTIEYDHKNHLPTDTAHNL